MEAQLENLIEKLKAEGVQAAQQKSSKIISDADKEAEKIIEKAKSEAKKILEHAKQETEKFKASAESAIKQAARDLILLLKEKIEGLFNRSLKNQIKVSLEPDFIKELIIKFVDQSKTQNTVEVIINESEKEKLVAFLQSSLKKELENEVEIKTSNRIDKGFRIGIKEQDVYYDFTEESISAALKEFLNPALARLLETS